MNFYKPILGIVFIVSAFVAFGCSGGNSRAEDSSAREEYQEKGAFSADSAFEYVVRQVEFGPRVPASESHGLCHAWLVAELKRLGADTVVTLGYETEAWNGDRLPVKNIFARFKGTGNGAPILLAAHYDTRPWADNDSDPSAHSKPIDGANDGASGVGVILEIARNIGKNPAMAPVDILLTDVEDYGTSDVDGSWCVGSRQFASELPYRVGELPRWGVLLDMVGGRDARFNREYFSMQVAPVPTAKIWDMAGKLGLRQRFPMRIGGAITDDHLPLSASGIPTTDIIESASASTGSFPAQWHTLDDNIDNIDPAALGDVGRTVLNVIYNEK